MPRPFGSIPQTELAARHAISRKDWRVAACHNRIVPARVGASEKIKATPGYAPMTMHCHKPLNYSGHLPNACERTCHDERRASGRQMSCNSVPRDGSS
jgi:hypothetical protein